MAVTHVATLRNTLAAAVLAAIGASGVLSFETTGGAGVVATLPLSATAGTLSGAILTFNPITSDTNAAGGTIAEFAIQTSALADVFRGSVTATGGGGDVTLSSLVITATDTVSVTALSYEAPL